MKALITVSVFLFFNIAFSQVGINTTTPSPASVLDISSSNNGSNYGGLMPPRVTISQRDLITVTAADDGLLVYVMDGIIRSLQIYNGVEDIWEIIHTQSISPSPILAGWEMNGVSAFGLSPFAATLTDASVTVGGLTRGAGITTSGGAAANAWGGNGFDLLIAEQASAIDAENFVTFTITPVLGATISLQSIDPYNIRRSGTGPTTGIWQYSIDGVNFMDIGSVINWGNNTAGAGNLQSAINLSGIPALQNLTSATMVTFRIVCWDASSSGGNWYINDFATSNDLIIRGNIN